MAGGVDTNILMASPPQHHKLRSVLGEDLAPRGLRQKLEEFVTERAEALVGELVARCEFDAVGDLARPFVMGIVYDLNGLPEAGRSHFFRWANDLFDALGVDNERSARAFASLSQMWEWLREHAGPDDVKPGSWAATILNATPRRVGRFPRKRRSGHAHDVCRAGARYHDPLVGLGAEALRRAS